MDYTWLRETIRLKEKDESHLYFLTLVLYKLGVADEDAVQLTFNELYYALSKA